MHLRSCPVIAVLATALVSTPAGAQVGVGENQQMTPGAREAADAKKLDGELNTLRDLFAALHACFTPPTLEAGHRGMQITMRFAFNRDGKVIGQPLVTYSSREVSQKMRDLYREAIMQSLQGCTPLPFTRDFANAIAGHPINFRVVDDRNDATR